MFVAFFFLMYAIKKITHDSKMFLWHSLGVSVNGKLAAVIWACAKKGCSSCRREVEKEHRGHGSFQSLENDLRVFYGP